MSEKFPAQGRGDLVLSLNLLIYKYLINTFLSACYNQCYNKTTSLRSAPNGQTSNYLCDDFTTGWCGMLRKNGADGET